MTLIRRTFTGATCACLLATMMISAAARPRTQFTLKIAPSQDALRPGVPMWKKGKPIFFILTMKNESDRVLYLGFTHPAFDYRTTVIDSQGQPVPETENLRKMRENYRISGMSRNMVVTLEPHKTCQDTIEVSFLYDLSKPGKYVVQLERNLPPELGEGIVKSNSVKISVFE